MTRKDLDITLQVKFHDTLKDKVSRTNQLQAGILTLSLPEQSTVQDLLSSLSLTDDWVGLIIVNRKQASRKSILADCDHIELFSPMAGG